jgi:hypothetical protein
VPVTYPITQPADNAAAYTYTQPIRDSIAAANDHQTRITSLEAGGGGGGGGVSLAASNTWTGNQRFTNTFGGDQTSPAGTYPSSGGGNPGIEFANGTSNWRIDNSGGSLRFLKASVGSAVTFDFSGNINTTGKVNCSSLGINSETSPRHPTPFLIDMDGSTFVTGVTPLADKVAHALTVTFKGGFSAEASRGLANPGWLWGANDFIISGSASGDLAGIQDLQGRLTEVHCNAPSAALNTLTGQQVEANVGSTATGANIVNAWALRVIGTRVNGGTVQNAYGALIEQPTISGTGSITGTNKALFVAGNTQLDGTLTLSSIATTTSASSGGASALPGTPAGYMTIQVGGTNRKVPYYA